MTESTNENTIDIDDVEGHAHSYKAVPDQDDVEGHIVRPRTTEDDDVEGHIVRPRTTEDDDVEGHARQR